MRPVRLIPLAVIILTMVLFVLFDAETYLSPAALVDMYREQPLQGGLLFVALYCLGTTLALPITALFAVIAGVLFGTMGGTAVALFSCLFGATCSFFISRYALFELVQRRFVAQFKVINRGIESDGFYYLLSLRMITVVPFSILNLLMGITTIRFGSYFLATTLGMLPILLALSNLGSQLSSIESLSMNDILSWKLLGSLAFLAILPLVSRWLMRRFIHRGAEDADS